MSPEDAAEINQLIDDTKLAETLTVPVEKPFDAMNLLDWIKLCTPMKGMGRLNKAYGSMDLAALASRFQHPLIRQALVDYMPPAHQAQAFLISYATSRVEMAIFQRAARLPWPCALPEPIRAWGAFFI